MRKFTQLVQGISYERRNESRDHHSSWDLCMGTSANGVQIVIYHFNAKFCVAIVHLSDVESKSRHFAGIFSSADPWWTTYSIKSWIKCHVTCFVTTFIAKHKISSVFCRLQTDRTSNSDYVFVTYNGEHLLLFSKSKSVLSIFHQQKLWRDRIGLISLLGRRVDFFSILLFKYL